MSMYGSVTDAQVFSRELSDQEMVDMTSCKLESKQTKKTSKIFLLYSKEVPDRRYHQLGKRGMGFEVTLEQISIRDAGS